jgi:hypothetical protein
MRRQNPMSSLWWVALILAPVSYWGLAQWLPRAQSPNPYLRMVLMSVAPALAPLIAGGPPVHRGSTGLGSLAVPSVTESAAGFGEFAASALVRF